MASFESIKGSPLAALGHCLREKEHYLNEDIDQARSHLNYTVSPESHGRSTRECMEYYEQLTDGVYHREKSTITTGQWVITAPEDLPAEKEKEFFESTYDFLNTYFFSGEDTRCLLAQVHRDESVIGNSHMHYIMTMPVVDNPKYISREEKILQGLKAAGDHFGLDIKKEDANAVYAAVIRYEQSHLTSRERYAIRDIAETFGMKRDDARWIFTRVRRLESERYEKRLMSKDQFLTKEMFNQFHPEYQKWMKEHGLSCTVFKGGAGIKLSVKELKQMTKNTGYRLVDQREYERLQNRVAELEQSLKEKERDSGWGRSGSHSDREWGSLAGWGKENTWERE